MPENCEVWDVFLLGCLKGKQVPTIWVGSFPALIPAGIVMFSESVPAIKVCSLLCVVSHNQPSLTMEMQAADE